MIDLAKPSRGSDMKVCHTMDQRSTNKNVKQMDEVYYRLQGRNNLVSTNGMINGGYQGYNDDGIVHLHSCLRLKRNL
jgi:hypothetical protein